MNRYQLAKLVSWAGRLHTRKRLQKVVYMLQTAGCPMEATYYLHHFGPYSDDVARLTDEMVRQQLFSEETEPVPRGAKYSYRLTSAVEQQLQELEQTPQGEAWAAELAPYEETAKELLEADLRNLEYASTIVFFRRQGADWPQAVEKAEKFKRTPAVRRGLPLAQKVMT